VGNKNLFSNYDQDDLEFEIRLGHKMQNTFVPSIKDDIKDKLIEKLLNENWNQRQTNTIDYYYNTQEGNRRISVNKESNEIIEDIIKGNFHLNDDFESQELKHTLRCNIKTEERRDLQDNNNIVPKGYNFVREKERLTFQRDEDLWWIDITTVTSHISNQTQNEKTYEVIFFFFLNFINSKRLNLNLLQISFFMNSMSLTSFLAVFGIVFCIFLIFLHLQITIATIIILSHPITATTIIQIQIQ
jgi:hypothetical protein